MQILEARCSRLLREAASQAVELASETNDIVVADFNGVLLYAYPDEKPSDAIGRWQREANRRRKVEEKKLRQQLQKKLGELMIKLTQLDFNDFEALIAWLGKIQEASDHISVKPPHLKILSIFKNHGYRPNANCGKKYNGDDKENSARYLIGQALESLRCPVHAIPGIFNKFANEWRKKFCK